MARLEVHPQQLTQFNLQIEEEIRHIRQWMQLVEECGEYDTMHLQQLQEMRQRLERMHLDLVQLHEINESVLVQCASMTRTLDDGLKEETWKFAQIFE